MPTTRRSVDPLVRAFYTPVTFVGRAHSVLSRARHPDYSLR
jgi:hypothetical protein